MKLKVIYEPAGRAREYAPLACNPWIVCTGKCAYCYAKPMARKTAEEFHKCPTPRDKLAAFENDCKVLRDASDERIIFMSFMCDPFQRFETDQEHVMIYRYIDIAHKHGRKIRTLTKVPSNCELFNMLPVDFGVTITGGSHTYEPGTDYEDRRMRCLIAARLSGHKTWVSMEPVMNPIECLQRLKDDGILVDFWRIGKLNARDSAMKKIEHSIDWKAFGKAVRDILPPEKYMLKEDLLREMGEL